MKMIRIAVDLLVAVTVVFLVVRMYAASEPIPQVGQMAPEFTLPSQDGTSIHLNEYRGKWVVLYFYPKDMTSGCTIEARNFQKDMDRFDAANAVVLGVSVQSVKSHQEFCAKDGLHFKLLSDTRGAVVRKYGSLGNTMGVKLARRNTFLIDPEGRVARVWVGVHPEEASSEVLDALHAIQKKS